MHIYMREWHPGDVTPLHSHARYRKSILVLRGRLEEYIEHMDGTDDTNIYETGEWFDMDASMGEHALHARTYVITLEAYVGHRECIPEDIRGERIYI